MSVELRHLGPSDAALLAALLADPSHSLIVALVGEEVVGQVVAVVHRHPDSPTELSIDNLGVTPARQRQGIGRSLLEAVRV